LNNVSDRLDVVKASVADQSGIKPMVAVGVIASGYYVSPTEDRATNELSVTQAVTVDDLVSTYKLKPSHLKIDVEGDEASVLRGAVKTLSVQDAPLIFLEMHNQIILNRGGDPTEAVKLLIRCGYKDALNNCDFKLNDLLRKEIVRIVAFKPTALSRQPYLHASNDKARADAMASV
jgi:FkbM family methyltransferase